MADIEKKITNRDRFSALIKIIETVGNDIKYPEGMSTEDMIEFLNRQIELLDNKVAAAQKRAAEKKAAGDELRARIYNILDPVEYLTITEIHTALNDPEVSPAMITSRLAQLASDEVHMAEKGKKKITLETGKTKESSAYRKLVNEGV